MRERRRDYELLFIISPLRSSEEEITTAINRVRQAITAASGEVTDVDQSPPWGRRKFAYPIREYAEGEPSRRSFTEGYYVLCKFNLAASRVADVERSLKLNDSVLRHMITLVETKGHVVAPVAAAPAGADQALEEEDEEDEEELDDEGDGRSSRALGRRR
jgi:small subunit ribosomal protein S6